MAASSVGGGQHSSKMIIIKRWRWRKIDVADQSQAKLENLVSGDKYLQQEPIGDYNVSIQNRLMPTQIRYKLEARDSKAGESSQRTSRRSDRIAMYGEDDYEDEKDNLGLPQDTREPPPPHVKLRAFSSRRQRPSECHRWWQPCDAPKTATATNLTRQRRHAKRKSRKALKMKATTTNQSTRLFLIIVCSINLISLLALANETPRGHGGETPFPSLEPKMTTSSFSLGDALQSQASSPLASALGEAHHSPLGQTDGAEHSAQRAAEQPGAAMSMPSDQDLLLQLLKSTGSVDEASKLIESLLLQEQTDHPAAAGQLIQASLQPPSADYNQVRASLDISSSLAPPPPSHKLKNGGAHLNPDFVDLQPDRVASDSQESPIRVSVEPPRASATGKPPAARGLFDEILAAGAAQGVTGGANVNVHYDDEPGQVAVAPAPEVTSSAIKQSTSKFLESLFARPSARGTGRESSSSELKAAATSGSSAAEAAAAAGEMPGGENLNNNESITSLLMRAGDASRQLIANYSTWINHERPVRKSLLAHVTPATSPATLATNATSSRARQPLRGGDFAENDSNLVTATASDDRPRGQVTSTTTKRPQASDKASLEHSNEPGDERADQIYSVGSRHEPTRMRPAARILQTHVNNLQDDTEKIRLSKKNETGLHRIVFINSMPHWTPARTRTTLKMLESSTGALEPSAPASQTEAPSIVATAPTPAYVEMAVYAQETTVRPVETTLTGSGGVTLNESQVPSTQLYSVEPYELGSSAGSERHQAPTTPLVMTTTAATERPKLATTTSGRLQQQEATNVATTVTVRNSTRAPVVTAVKRKSTGGSRANSRSSSRKTKSSGGKVKSTKKRLKSVAITKKPSQQVVVVASSSSSRPPVSEVPATTELAETTIPPSASTTVATSLEPPANQRSGKSLNLARLFLGTTGLDDLVAPTTQAIRYQPSFSSHQPTGGQLDHLYGSSSFSLMPTTQSMMISSGQTDQFSSADSPDPLSNFDKSSSRVRVLPPDVAAPTPDSLSVFTGQSADDATTSSESMASARNRWRAVELPLREHSAQALGKGRRKASVIAGTRNRPDSLLLNLTTTTQVYDRSYEDLIRQTTTVTEAAARNDSIRRSTVTTSTFSPLMLDDQPAQEQQHQVNEPTDYSHAQLVVFPQMPSQQQVVADQASNRNEGSTTTTTSTSLELDQTTTPMLAPSRTTPAPRRQQLDINRAGASHDRPPPLNSSPPVINQQVVANGSSSSSWSLYNFEPTAASPPLMVTGDQRQQVAGERNYGKRLVGGSRPTSQADIELADQSWPPSPTPMLAANKSPAGDSIKANAGESGRFQSGELSAHVRPLSGQQLRPEQQVSTEDTNYTPLPPTTTTTMTTSSQPPLVYVEPSRPSATPPSEIVTAPTVTEEPLTELRPDDPQAERTTATTGSIFSALSLDDPLPSILHHNRLSSLFKYKMANRTAQSTSAPSSSSSSSSSSPFLLHIGQPSAAAAANRGNQVGEGQQFVYPFEYQQIKDHSQQKRQEQQHQQQSSGAVVTNQANNASGNEQAKLNNVALSQMVARLIGSSSGGGSGAETARANKSSESGAEQRATRNNGFYGNFYHSNQSSNSTTQAGNFFELSPNATTSPSSSSSSPARLFRREKNRSRLQQSRPTQTPTTEVTYGSTTTTTMSHSGSGGNKNYELIKMGNDDDAEDVRPSLKLNNSIVSPPSHSATLSQPRPPVDETGLSNGSDVFITSTPAAAEATHDKSLDGQSNGSAQRHPTQGNNGSESGLSSSSNSGELYENSENSGDLNVYIKPIARDEQPSNNRWLLPQIDSGEHSSSPHQKQRVAHQTRAVAAAAGSGRQRVDKRKRRREPPVLLATPTSEPPTTTTAKVSEPTLGQLQQPVVDSASSLDDNSLGNLFSRLPQAYRPVEPVRGNVNATDHVESGQSVTTTGEPPAAAGEYATAATSEQPASLSELPPSSSANPTTGVDESMIVDGSQNWKSSSLSPLADDYRSKSLLRTMINLGAPSGTGSSSATSATDKSTIGTDKSKSAGGRESVRVVKVAKLRSRHVAGAGGTSTLAPSTSRPATTTTTTTATTTTTIAATTTTILPSSSTQPTSERPQMASTRAPGSRWRSFSTADRLSKQPIAPPRLNLGGVSVRADEHEETQGGVAASTSPMTTQRPVSSSPAPTEAPQQAAEHHEFATERPSSNDNQPIVVVLSPSAGGGLEPTNLDKVSTLLRATIERVAATSTRAPATTTLASTSPSPTTITTTTVPTTSATMTTPTTRTEPADQTTPLTTESSLTTSVVQTEIQLAPKRTIFRGGRDKMPRTTTNAPTTTTSGPREPDFDRTIEMMSGSSDQRTTSLNTMRMGPTTTSMPTTSTPRPRRPQSIFDTNFRRQVSESGGDLQTQPKRNQRHQPESGEPTGGENTTHFMSGNFESGNLDERDFHSPSAQPPVARQGLNSFQRAAIVTIIICCVLIVACLLVAAISIKCNSLVASQAADSARRRRKRCDALARLNASGYGLDGHAQVRHSRSRSLGLLARHPKHSGLDSQMEPEMAPTSKRARKVAAKAHRAAARRAKSCGGGGGGAKLLLSNAELNNSSDGGQQCSSAESTASICVSTSSEGMDFVASKVASAAARAAAASHRLMHVSGGGGAHHPSRHRLHQSQQQHAGKSQHKHSSHQHGVEQRQQQPAGYSSRTIRERISGTITSRLLRLHLPRLMPYFTPDENLQQQQFNNQRLANNLSQYQQQQHQFAVAQKHAAHKPLPTSVNNKAQNFHMAPRLSKPAAQVKTKGKASVAKLTGCAYARREVNEQYQCNCASCGAQVASSMWSFKENNMTRPPAATGPQATGSRTTSTAGKLPFGAASSVLRQTSQQQPLAHYQQQVSAEPTSGGGGGGGISMMPIPPLRTLTTTRRAYGSSQAGSDCLLPGDNASAQHSQMDNEHHMLIDDMNVNNMPLRNSEYHHHSTSGAAGVYRNLATSNSNLNLMHEFESRYGQQQQHQRNFTSGARFVPKNSDHLTTTTTTTMGDTRHLLIDNHHHNHLQSADNQDQTIDRIDEDSRAEVADQEQEDGQEEEVTDNMSESENYYNLQEHQRQHQQERRQAVGTNANPTSYQTTATNHDETTRNHRMMNLTLEDNRQHQQQQQLTGSNCNCNLILYPL